MNSLTIQDYLNCLEDYEIKNEAGYNTTWTSRCPLHHNHPNGDRNKSFIISRGTKGQIVVYTCRAPGGDTGKCNQKALTSWFVKQFKNKNLLSVKWPKMNWGGV